MPGGHHIIKWHDFIQCKCCFFFLLVHFFILSFSDCVYFFLCVLSFVSLFVSVSTSRCVLDIGQLPGGLVVEMLACCTGGHEWRTKHFSETFISKIPFQLDVDWIELWIGGPLNQCKISHTWGECVTCCGLSLITSSINPREQQELALKGILFWLTLE